MVESREQSPQGGRLGGIGHPDRQRSGEEAQEEVVPPVDQIELADYEGRIEFIDPMSGVDENMWLTFSQLGEHHAAMFVLQRLSRERIESMVALPEGICLIQLNRFRFAVCQADRLRASRAFGEVMHKFQWAGMAPGHVMAAVRQSGD